MILKDSIKRYNTCKSCDRFNKVFKTCKECGCFMPLKTKLKKAYCPIGKWGNNPTLWGSEIDDK